jgi:hypothetical protein
VNLTTAIGLASGADMDTTARLVRAREEIEDDHQDHLALRAKLDDGTERVISQHLWALFMLARTAEVAGSIVRGLPVRTGGLDAEALRRGLRGGALPAPDSFLVVTDAMLEAINEAGPLQTSTRTRRQ